MAAICHTRTETLFSPLRPGPAITESCSIPSWTAIPSSLTVKVKALPGARNDGKTEVVGNFNITSNISKTEAYANEPITFTVTVSGNGNLHHVSDEDFNIDFPADCDVTYPKVISHISAKGDIVTDRIAGCMPDR